VWILLYILYLFQLRVNLIIFSNCRECFFSMFKSSKMCVLSFKHSRDYFKINPMWQNEETRKKEKDEHPMLREGRKFGTMVVPWGEFSSPSGLESGRYARSEHEKECPWNMMHDTRHGIVFGTRTVPFPEKSPSDEGTRATSVRVSNGSNDIGAPRSA